MNFIGFHSPAYDPVVVILPVVKRMQFHRCLCYNFIVAGNEKRYAKRPDPSAGYEVVIGVSHGFHFYGRQENIYGKLV
jgi:hypothetical protein